MTGLELRPTDRLRPAAPAHPLDQTGFRRGVVIPKRGRSLRLRLPFGGQLPDRNQIMAIVALLAAAWLFWNLERPIDMGIRERSVLLSRADVQRAAIGALDTSGEETWSGVKRLGGDRQLSYRFESHGSEVMRVEVDLCDDHEGAVSTYRRRSMVDTTIDWQLGKVDRAKWEEGVGLVVLDEDLPFGNESHIYRVEQSGIIQGYGGTVRLGTRVLYVHLRGVEFAPGVFECLIDEAVTDLARYVP